MIRFPVQDIGRPPARFGHLGINSLRYTSNHFPSIVWKMHLLPRLHELDIRLGNGAAVQLLEILKRLLVVSSQKVSITYAKNSSSRGRSRRRRGRLRGWSDHSCSFHVSSLSSALVGLPFARNHFGWSSLAGIKPSRRRLHTPWRRRRRLARVC